MTNNERLLMPPATKKSCKQCGNKVKMQVFSVQKRVKGKWKHTGCINHKLK